MIPAAAGRIYFPGFGTKLLANILEICCLTGGNPYLLFVVPKTKNNSFGFASSQFKD